MVELPTSVLMELAAERLMSVPEALDYLREEFPHEEYGTKWYDMLLLRELERENLQGVRMGSQGKGFWLVDQVEIRGWAHRRIQGNEDGEDQDRAGGG